MGSPVPNFTLEGHEKGVNTLDYYSGGDRPYLVSGADDRLIKVGWGPLGVVGCEAQGLGR